VYRVRVQRRQAADKRPDRDARYGVSDPSGVQSDVDASTLLPSNVNNPSNAVPHLMTTALAAAETFTTLPVSDQSRQQGRQD
jgi:hypothetical protein